MEICRHGIVQEHCVGHIIGAKFICAGPYPTFFVTGVKNLKQFFPEIPVYASFYKGLVVLILVKCP